MMGGPLLIGVATVGALVIMAGVVLVVAPGRFIAILQGMDSVVRFRFAVLARLGIGLLFVFAAPQTLWPAHIRVLGWFIFAAAFVILLMGRKRLDSLMDAVTKWPKWALRSWSVVAFVGGLLLVKAAL